MRIFCAAGESDAQSAGACGSLALAPAGWRARLRRQLSKTTKAHVWGPPGAQTQHRGATAVGRAPSAPQALQKRGSDARGTHKVHPNGGDVALSVGVVSETEEQAGLAHTRVPDQLRKDGQDSEHPTRPQHSTERRGPADPRQ